MTATAQLGLGDVVLRLVALSDKDLVRRLYEAIDRVADQHLVDQLFNLATEVVERWSPPAEWAMHVAYHTENTPPEEWAAELEANREAMANRAGARVQALGQMGGRS